jgi:transposase
MKNEQRLLQIRRERGYRIAKEDNIISQNGKWLVPSESSPHKNYEVVLKIDRSTCTCQDFLGRGIKCKHIFAVEIVTSKQINTDGSVTVTQTKRVTYSQDWANYNKAQVNQKEMFMKLLNGLCQSIDEPSYTFGRPRLPLSDMVFASALKVFTTFSLRRFMSDMRTALEKGYTDTSCTYVSVSNYMKDPELTPLLKKLITASALPLKAMESNFSIDSSGFSTSRFSRWYDHKYGKEKDVRVWYKAHLVNGNSTHIVSAVEITDAYENDTVMLEQLTKETHQNFDVKELSADMGYMSRHNYDVLAGMDITPYIPFKTNVTGQPKGHNHIWRQMYGMFMYRQDEFLTHYHQRSNVETVFHMIKSKFSGNIRSKDETACINEVLLKVLCHNICVLIEQMFELGVTPDFVGA